MKDLFLPTPSLAFVYVAAPDDKSVWYNLDDGITDVAVLNEFVPACLVFPDGVKRSLSPLSLAVLRHEAKAMLEVPARGRCLVIRIDHVSQSAYEVLAHSPKVTASETTPAMSFMEMNTQLKSFLDIMMNIYKDNFSDMEQTMSLYKQFFYILCTSLPVSQLYSLLSPVLRDTDAGFRNQVLRCYVPGYKAKALAAACGYTYNAFLPIFQREFGISPGKWLRRQNISELLRLLAFDLPLAEVADRMNMSSVQHLTRFCKDNVGHTPAELRLIVSDCTDNAETLRDIMVRINAPGAPAAAGDEE